MMTEQKLREFYRTMTLIRLTEERIGELAESGEVRCPCHLYIGQEAIAAGVCATLGSAIRFGAPTVPTGITWRRGAT